MKKSSRFYFSITIASFVLCQAIAALFLCCLLFLDGERSVFSISFFIFMIVLAELSCFLLWRAARFSRNRYQFDAQGITVTRGKRTTRLAWDDCREVGLATTQVNQAEQLLFAYATTKPLTSEEKSKFLPSRKNDWEHTAFFQCDKDSVKELMAVLPRHFAEDLQADLWRMTDWFSNEST